MREDILDRAYELVFEDLYLTLNEAYQMAVEEFARECEIPLRTFKDPINGDLYVAIGEGVPEE